MKWHNVIDEVFLFFCVGYTGFNLGLKPMFFAFVEAMK
jgi:hypothetical protein